HKIRCVACHSLAICYEQDGCHQNEGNGQFTKECGGGAIHAGCCHRVSHHIVTRRTSQDVRGNHYAGNGTEELSGRIKECIPKGHFPQPVKSKGYCRVEMPPGLFAQW